MLIDYNPMPSELLPLCGRAEMCVLLSGFWPVSGWTLNLWHGEKLAYCRHQYPLPEPVLFPGVTPATNTPVSADTGNNCTGTGSPLPPAPPPAQDPGRRETDTYGRTAIRRCPVC